MVNICPIVSLSSEKDAKLSSFLHMCLRCSNEFACIIFTKLRGREVNEWTNANYIDVLQASVTEKRYNRRATQSCNVYLCKIYAVIWPEGSDMRKDTNLKGSNASGPSVYLLNWRKMILYEV